MKNYFGLLLLSALILLVGCGDDNSDNEIRFVTSADYPPFEYKEHGELVGFDIELAKLIASELGKEAVFEEVEFSNRQFMFEQYKMLVESAHKIEERRGNSNNVFI